MHRNPGGVTTPLLGNPEARMQDFCLNKVATASLVAHMLDGLTLVTADHRSLLRVSGTKTAQKSGEHTKGSRHTLLGMRRTLNPRQ
jgi:hypothetical protein